MIQPWTQSLINHEEKLYQSIYTTLLMSGEYREQDIDAQVHEIMDNPSIYKEYFVWTTRSYTHGAVLSALEILSRVSM